MKRSELKRTTPLRASSGIQREAKPDRGPRKRMKQSRPKMTPIRKAARGQECTLRFDGCIGGTETTVLCHSNRLADGKGMGLKAPDTCAVFGCAACHDVLDGRAPRPDGLSHDAMLERFGLALERTHIILHTKGLLP